MDAPWDWKVHVLMTCMKLMGNTLNFKGARGRHGEG